MWMAGMAFVAAVATTLAAPCLGVAGVALLSIGSGAPVLALALHRATPVWLAFAESAGALLVIQAAYVAGLLLTLVMPAMCKRLCLARVGRAAERDSVTTP